jgi:two-component system NtrC family response regulator
MKKQFIKQPTILIVEDERETAKDLAQFCKEAGFSKPLVAEDREQAKNLWASNSFDALLLDLKLKRQTNQDQGFELLRDLRSRSGQPRRVFIYSGHLASLRLPIDAVASDTVSAFNKSDDEDKLRQSLKDFVTTFEKSPAAMVFAGCDEMRTIEDSLPSIVASELPVLLLGGTGDGKTMLAWRIAKDCNSRASRRELVNCAAIPENLFESVLFGHKKGAFTGAIADSPGKLMTASGFTEINSSYQEGCVTDKNDDDAIVSKDKNPGVVIFDELAAMPMYLQAKLLSVLDGEPIKPIGYRGGGFVPNFRVIATTNEIERLQDPDLFRLDLRKRIEGWVIHMPPMHKQEKLIRELVKRERPTVRKEAGHREPVVIEWTPDAVSHLVANAAMLDGGIRELKNIIARAVLYSYFDGKNTVSVEAVTKALAQRLPSQGAKGQQAGASRKQTATAARLTKEDIVEKLKVKLKELGVTNAALVGENVQVLDYTEVGKVLSKRNGKALVEWIIADASLKKKRGDDETEANFLAALGYSGINTNPRGTIYGNWMKRSGNEE